MSDEAESVDLYSNDTKPGKCSKLDNKKTQLLCVKRIKPTLIGSVVLSVAILLCIVFVSINKENDIKTGVAAAKKLETIDWSNGICFTCTNLSDVSTYDVNLIHVNTSHYLTLCCLKAMGDIKWLIQLVIDLYYI